LSKRPISTGLFYATDLTFYRIISQRSKNLSKNLQPIVRLCLCCYRALVRNRSDILSSPTNLPRLEHSRAIYIKMAQLMCCSRFHWGRLVRLDRSGSAGSTCVVPSRYYVAREFSRRDNMRCHVSFFLSLRKPHSWG